MTRPLLATLLLLSLLGNLQAQGPRVEDRTKFVGFTPPDGWTYSEESDAGALVFDGPKVSGGASRLTLRATLDGRPTDQVFETILQDELLLPADALREPWELGDQPGPFELAVTWEQRIERQTRRHAVAVMRNGTHVVSFCFDAVDTQFARVESELLACLAGVTPLERTPVAGDDLLGVRLHVLPEDFEPVPEETQAGEVMTWSLARGDTVLGTIRVYRADLAEESSFGSWMRKRVAAAEEDLSVAEAVARAFPVCGRTASMLRVEGTGPRLELFVPRDDDILVVHCSARSREFNRGLERAYLELLRSLEVLEPMANDAGLDEDEEQDERADD